MNDLQQEYKGANISYSEYSNKWSVEIEHNTLKNDCESLTKAKEYVDRHSKKEMAFKNIEAWKSIRWGTKGYLKVKITSKDEDGENCWITSSEGRGKYQIKNLYEVTPQNQILINAIATAEKTKKEIEDSIDQLRSELTVIHFNKEEEDPSLPEPNDIGSK